jgi:NAD(P)-dependent dehydrogenase (short-subunit alcohol dehydrogenase family)
MADEKIALVTGANRGLGKGLCEKLAGEGWRVLMVCRDEASGRAAEKELKDAGGNVQLFVADMANTDDIDRLFDEVSAEVDHIDALVNNAAVNPDETGAKLWDTELDTLQQALDTNIRGPVWMCVKFVPLVRKSTSGRIINYTSGLGRLGIDHPGSYSCYSISKVAVNGLTKVLAKQLKGDGVIVASVDPGWVKTRMGGEGAQLELSEGIKGAYHLATAPAEELETGRIYYQDQVLGW